MPAEAEAKPEVAVAKRRSGVSKKSGPSGPSGLPGLSSRSRQQGRSNWPARLLVRKSPRKTQPKAKSRDACTCNAWWALTVCVPPPGTAEHEARALFASNGGSLLSKGVCKSVAQMCMELGPNEVLDNGPDPGIQSFARYGQWIFLPGWSLWSLRTIHGYRGEDDDGELVSLIPAICDFLIAGCIIVQACIHILDLPQHSSAGVCLWCVGPQFWRSTCGSHFLEKIVAGGVLRPVT